MSNTSKKLNEFRAYCPYVAAALDRVGRPSNSRQSSEIPQSVKDIHTLIVQKALRDTLTARDLDLLVRDLDPCDADYIVQNAMVNLSKNPVIDLGTNLVWSLDPRNVSDDVRAFIDNCLVSETSQIPAN